MTSCRGPVALITGGSGSLGSAVARELSGRGYSVMLVGRSEERLARAARAALAAASGEERAIAWRRADVTSIDQVLAVVEETLDAWGRIDALLALAGYERDFAELMPLRPSPAVIAAAEAVVQTDLLGTLRAVFAVEPVMRRQGRGTILTLGTTPTIDVRADHLVYQVARAGLRQLVEVLAKQHLADGVDGVRALWVALGNVYTPATYEGMSLDQRAAADERGWLSAARHVAPLMAWLLDERLPRSDGATIRVDAAGAPALFAEAGVAFERFDPALDDQVQRRSVA
jgi:3-oxoacyl-[acyl-carrier protein] reductase